MSEAKNSKEEDKKKQTNMQFVKPEHVSLSSCGRRCITVQAYF